MRTRSHAAVTSLRPASIVLRLPCRTPFDGDAVVEFLAARARARHRRGGGHDLPAHAAAGPRCGRGRADPAARPRPRRAPARRPSRPHHGRAAVPASVRPRRRPAGRRRAARRRPHPRPARREGAGAARCRAPSTASSSRRAPCSGSRSRLRPRARWPRGSSPSHGTPLATPDGGLTHLFPEAEDIVELALGSARDARVREGRCSTALAAAVSERRGRRRRRRRPCRDDRRLARHPRCRPVDGVLHHDARSR